MNWKEKLLTFLTSKKPWTKHKPADFEYFIQTEIIEKLIEDIPDNAFIEADPTKQKPLMGEEFKQQLRDKWL